MDTNVSEQIVLCASYEVLQPGIHDLIQMLKMDIRPVAFSELFFQFFCFIFLFVPGLD